MEITDLARNVPGWLPKGLVNALERILTKMPWYKNILEKQYDGLMEDLGESLQPYKDDYAVFDRIPAEGRDRQEILREIEELKGKEESRWKEGYVSGAVYHGDDAHTDFLSDVYRITSQVNPLHFDLWPSATKFEAEIVAMTAAMLGGDQARGSSLGLDGKVCGVVSSGGTESIMLAMRTYRDWARDRKGIKRPRMIVPTTVHAAFDKAARYFNMEIVKIPVGPDFRADVAATRRAINRNTIVIVGSAPAYPHGVIDPIEELAALAAERGIGFHTDACLGGFLLPWAAKLGREVPAFDFRVPGVTSISADTHKFGYAAKGTSVILYRDMQLRHYQYYTVTDWPGGLYFSPTFAGSRAGALGAMCWAAMVSMGEKGYLEAAEKILTTADRIKSGLDKIPELQVLGDPLFCIAMASDALDIYRVMDFMTERRWNLNGLFSPAAMHICVTLRHTGEGVAERFIRDLEEAVAHVKANPGEKGGMAPVYGMAAAIPLKGAVSGLLKRYLDRLYQV